MPFLYHFGGNKGVFDYAVFTPSVAAFALGLMKDKYLEWLVGSMQKNRNGA